MRYLCYFIFKVDRIFEYASKNIQAVGLFDSMKTQWCLFALT